MNNFSFHNPTHIHFGRGQIARLTQEIPQDTKVLITYGGGSIKTNGVLAQVHAALSDHRVLEFGGIEPNPSYETLVEAVKLAKAENIDFLLAVGGGSVVDGTKFIAAAMGFEGDPWAILSEKASIDTAPHLSGVSSPCSPQGPKATRTPWFPESPPRKNCPSVTH